VFGLFYTQSASNMIKLLRDYKQHQKDDLVDLGCVLNRRLVDVGYAVWIKVEDVKFKVK